MLLGKRRASHASEGVPCEVRKPDEPLQWKLDAYRAELLQVFKKLVDSHGKLWISPHDFRHEKCVAGFDAGVQRDAVELAKCLREVIGCLGSCGKQVLQRRCRGGRQRSMLGRFLGDGKRGHRVYRTRRRPDLAYPKWQPKIPGRIGLGEVSCRTFERSSRALTINSPSMFAASSAPLNPPSFLGSLPGVRDLEPRATTLSTPVTAASNVEAPHQPPVINNNNNNNDARRALKKLRRASTARRRRHYIETKALRSPAYRSAVCQLEEAKSIDREHRDEIAVQKRIAKKQLSLVRLRDRMIAREMRRQHEAPAGNVTAAELQETVTWFAWIKQQVFGQ